MMLQSGSHTLQHSFCCFVCGPVTCQLLAGCASFHLELPTSQCNFGPTLAVLNSIVWDGSRIFSPQTCA